MWQATTAVATTPRGAEALASPRYELIPLTGVMEQASHLPRGATVTVTCSPKHGIDASLDLAERLAAAGFHAIPHVAARLVTSRSDLQRILDRLAAAGLDDVFIVGGDAPSPAGPYPGGRELLEDLDTLSRRPRRIGVPSYPEPHATIPPEQMQAALDVKNALADYTVTQICFDADTILSWLADQHDRGLRLPVYMGLPGVIDRMKLMGLAMRIGLGASTRVLRRQAGLASRLLGGSTYRPDALAEALVPAFDGPLAPALAGFHLNTFNQIAETATWAEATAATLHPCPPRDAGQAHTAAGTPAGYY
ncbi:methylenetetrahydrofolate reductase [Aquisalimonas asiatica]|uniref:Methylenetetrahydrofolate reductase n=1 Tax=Aquisalimonas asiatica TaxID=406100 RepID=A0A1H8UVC0_9GAMM|nr:methylenetetrahydrofolate reductase [Aquisalimonas asiatica]SEP06884.1 methylenetetrahydrofolate reductase (NADPH) [Aquisalimonas asiatica]